MKLIKDAEVEGFKCLEWKGAHHKSIWLCPNNHTFEKRASLLKHSGYSCPECWKIRNKTKEGFKVQSGGNSIQLTSDPIKDFEDQGYKVVGTYVRAHSNVDLICPNGHKCSISRSNFRNGYRCRVCKFEKQARNNRRKTYDKYKRKIEKEGYVLLTRFDDYEDVHTRLEIRRPDQTVFDTCIANMLVAQHFDSLYTYEQRRQSQIDKIMDKIDGGFSIMDPHRYKNQNSILTFRCDKGHLFEKKVTRFRSNYCPQCKQASTEKRWTHWLESRNIKYISPYREHGFEIDIYLPEHKVGLEICGLIFHSENDIFRKNRPNRRRHIDKRKRCEELGIRLFTIYENENDSPIVESIILNAIGMSKRLFARKLQIREVSNKDAKVFFDDNHLMGHAVAKFVGLFDGEELMCAFGYKKIGHKIEITRFATKKGYTVVGGFSKLLKEAINRANVKHVVSYLDLRYSNGKSYEKTGFTKTGETLGWKWTDFRETYNRLRCRANMDERRLSEREHAAELGWYKIYDCGQAKYELTLE